MKREALDKFFKPAVKNPQLVNNSKGKLEENTTVTTELTMDVKNVSTINMDNGTVSIELFEKKIIPPTTIYLKVTL
jgi:hypothetical protein